MTDLEMVLAEKFGIDERILSDMRLAVQELTSSVGLPFSRLSLEEEDPVLATRLPPLWRQVRDLIPGEIREQDYVALVYPAGITARTLKLMDSLLFYSLYKARGSLAKPVTDYLVQYFSLCQEEGRVLSRGALQQIDSKIYRGLERGKLLELIPRISREIDLMKIYWEHCLAAGELQMDTEIRQVDGDLHSALQADGLLDLLVSALEDSSSGRKSRRSYTRRSQSKRIPNDYVKWYEQLCASTGKRLNRRELGETAPNVLAGLYRRHQAHVVPLSPRGGSKLSPIDRYNALCDEHGGIVTRRMLREIEPSLYNHLARSHLLHVVPKHLGQTSHQAEYEDLCKLLGVRLNRKQLREDHRRLYSSALREGWIDAVPKTPKRIVNIDDVIITFKSGILDELYSPYARVTPLRDFVRDAIEIAHLYVTAALTHEDEPDGVLNILGTYLPASYDTVPQGTIISTGELAKSRERKRYSISLPKGTRDRLEDIFQVLNDSSRGSIIESAASLLVEQIHQYAQDGTIISPNVGRLSPSITLVLSLLPYSYGSMSSDTVRRNIE